MFHSGPRLKWLVEVGAGDDISSLTFGGTTILHYACAHVNLPVCKWLLGEASAGRDGIITKRNANGETPMRVACDQGLIRDEWCVLICILLAQKGALNDPDSAEERPGVSRAIVERDVVGSFSRSWRPGCSTGSRFIWRRARTG